MYDGGCQWPGAQRVDWLAFRGEIESLQQTLHKALVDEDASAASIYKILPDADTWTSAQRCHFAMTVVSETREGFLRMDDIVACAVGEVSAGMSLSADKGICMITILSKCVPVTELAVLFSNPIAPVLDACRHRCVLASAASNPDVARRGLVRECVTIAHFLPSLPGAVVLLGSEDVQKAFENCFLQSNWLTTPGINAAIYTEGVTDFATAVRESCLSDEAGGLTFDIDLRTWTLRLFCSALEPASCLRHCYTLASRGGLPPIISQGIRYAATMVLQAVHALVISLFQAAPESVSSKAVAIARTAQSKHLDHDKVLLGRASLDVLDGAACEDIEKTVRRLKPDRRASLVERKHDAYLFCNNCSRGDRGTLSLQKCSRCCLVRYCDPACQKVHWDAHKTNCKAMRTIARDATG